MDDIKITDWLSVLISAIALLLSVIAIQISRKGVRIATKEWNSKSSLFSISIDEAKRVILKDQNADNKRYLLFKIMVVNQSHLKTSLQFHLQLTYKKDEKRKLISIAYDHLPIPETIKKQDTLFTTLTSIEEKGSVIGWLAFADPMLNDLGYLIDYYEIVAEDAHGLKVSAVATLLKNVNYES